MSEAHVANNSHEVVVGRTHLFHRSGATNGRFLFVPWNDALLRGRIDELLVARSRSQRALFVTIEIGRKIPSFRALAADARYVYWSVEPGEIGRASVDGSQVEPEFVRVGEYLGTGLAVHDGFLYWTQDNQGGGWMIGRARVDGSDVRESFIDPAVVDEEFADGDPGPLAVDDDYIYVGGHEQDDGTYTITRVRLDGSDLQIRFVAGLTGQPTSLGVTPP